MNDRTDLAGFLEQAWDILVEGVENADAPARLPALASIGLDGAPEVRTVALRRADPDMGIVEMHTDIASHKVASLRKDPRAELHVWVPQSQIQIRAALHIEILSGESLRPIWDEVPDASRKSYGTTPAPGTPIEGPFKYEKPKVFECFAVLRGQVNRFDLVDLNLPHRRARLERTNGWTGTWVSP